MNLELLLDAAKFLEQQEKEGNKDTIWLLNELPEDVLLLVLEKCTAQDLTALAQTCVRFAVLTHLDVLWKSLCRKRYNVLDLGNIESYYCLYSQLLHDFGWMLGMFQCQTTPRGGLLEVKYYEGVIQGIQWVVASRSLNDPLVMVPMFEVTEGNQHPQCLQVYCEDHRAEMRKVDNHTFVYTCKKKSCHGGELNVKNNQKHENIYKGITYKRLFISSLKEIPPALKLRDGSASPQIITPGLFIADYSIHAIEMVLFSFNDINEIHGIKVTGDPNVFSGKLSVKFNIRYPIRPTLEEQRSLGTLRDLSPVETDIQIEPVPEQKFVLPYDCYYNGDNELPTFCKARYHGHGQVASTNFKNPSYTPAHVMIFNNDLLGVMLLDLQFFMIYHRKNLN